MLLVVVIVVVVAVVVVVVIVVSTPQPLSSYLFFFMIWFDRFAANGTFIRWNKKCMLWHSVDAKKMKSFHYFIHPFFRFFFPLSTFTHASRRLVTIPKPTHFNINNNSNNNNNNKKFVNKNFTINNHNAQTGKTFQRITQMKGEKNTNRNASRKREKKSARDREMWE